MVDMSDKMKENFEEIKARIDEHKDDFEDIKKSVGDLTDKLKDVKEGWETSRAEKGDKKEVAEHEETHQTHCSAEPPAHAPQQGSAPSCRRFVSRRKIRAYDSQDYRRQSPVRSSVARQGHSWHNRHSR